MPSSSCALHCDCFPFVSLCKYSFISLFYSSFTILKCQHDARLPHGILYKKKSHVFKSNHILFAPSTHVFSRIILSSCLSELINQAELLREDGECQSFSFPPGNRPIIHVVSDGESVLVDVIIGILMPSDAHRLSMRWPSTTNHCCLSGTPHARRQILELLIRLAKPVSVSLVSVT